MKQSVLFDTEIDSPEAVALAIAYAFGFDSVEDLLDTTGEATDEEDTEKSPNGSYPAGWSTSKMRRYTKALKPTAQKVLRAIAENAPEADVDTVQTASGIDGYKFAGSMSSFGFAARNTYGVKDKPFARVGGHYEMNTEVAKLALAVLTELGL